MKKQTGFTLIEVMIALVVVSVALGALSQTLGRYLFNQAGLKERVVASWVAQNRLIEIQSGLMQTTDQSKTVPMLNNDWQVSLKTQPTMIPGLNRADLTVYQAGSEQAIVTVSSIVGDPNAK